MCAFARRNALLLLLGALGLLGVVVAIALQEHSFPVARVEFRLLRPEAEQAAREYLAERGFDLSGYQSALSFEVDDSAKDYVEHKAGLAQLNRLAAGELSIWRWRVRFFRELQQEEFNVYLAPEGHIVGFSHHLPEAAPGASPEGEQAQTLAAYHLRATGRDLADYRLVSASSLRREARTDHTFTWESERFRLDQATYRVDVWTLGDQVGGYFEYLKVPEDWRRAQAMEANRGWLLASVGWLFTYGLALVMALVCLLRLRAGAVQWRFALSLAVMMLAIALAVGVNAFPLLLVGYPTTSTLAAYLLGQLQSQAAGLLPTGAAVVLAGVAGDWVYSNVFRQHLPPHVLFSRRGFRSAEFAVALLAGYAVAGIWLAYVTGFYSLASSWFGAWSPAELPYRDLMSTFLPGLYPLTVGFGAAVSEEFAFRLFAVPLLLWLAWGALARSRGLAARPGLLRLARAAAAVLAVVLPAFVWGSLHSTYPQQPFYIRAIEVGIIGCLEALLMFRFGILATITAHYAYNASVIGGLFLLSPNWYLRASAVVVIALPLAFLLPAALRRFRRLPLFANEDLVEPGPGAGETAPVAVRLAAGEGDWFPPRARLRELALAGVVCLALAAFWQVPRLGDGLQVALGREEAAARADAVLRELGLDPDGWHQVTGFHDWSLGNHVTYLLRRLGTTATNEFLQNEVPSYVWQTRYYRPLEREEISLRFDQTSRLHSLDHRLPEDAPGARLTREQAQSLAEGFARAHGQGEALRGELVTASSLERKARIDHTFEWETEDTRLGEATFRLRVGIEGDQVGEFSTYLKIPEAFDRQLAHQSEANVALDLLREGMESAVYFIAIVVFVLRFRRGLIDLRFAAGSAGLLAALSLLGTLNGLPTFWSGYWTTIEAEGFIVSRLVRLAREVGGEAAWYFVLFGVGESLFREQFPRLAPLGAQVRRALSGEGPASAIGVCALAMAPGLWLLLSVYRAAREAFAAGTLVAEGTVPAHLLNGLSPALEVARGNLHFALWVVLGALPTTLWLYGRLRRRWAVALIWAVALAILYAGRPEEWQRNLVELARWAALVGLVYLAASRYAGPNLLAYALALYTFLAARDAHFLLQQPQPYYVANGVVALALATLPALFFVWRGFASRSEERPAPVPT